MFFRLQTELPEQFLQNVEIDAVAPTSNHRFCSCCLLQLQNTIEVFVGVRRVLMSIQTESDRAPESSMWLSALLNYNIKNISLVPSPRSP